MYRVDACLACGSATLGAHPALLAPFIADYVLGQTPRLVRLLSCKGCGLRFFEDRYEPAEVERLYQDYRGEDYFRRRHRWEFWYTRRFNGAIGAESAQLLERQERFLSFLRKFIDPADVEDVLDFGGDRGQFLPRGLGRRRHVLDVSGVSPVPGVSSWRSPAELPRTGFDLVVLSHVLEHCSDPMAVLADLRTLARPGGTRFYIEVPLEEIDLRFVPDWDAYRGYLTMLTALGPALQVVDLVSTAVRFRWGLVPPLGFLKQHEHICYFRDTALRAMLERAGFRVLGCVESGRSPTGLPPAVLCVAEALPP